jgi:hypothetical protein
MYNEERELKKLRSTVRNKARVEGCIAEAFTCKEITKFSTLQETWAHLSGRGNKFISTNEFISNYIHRYLKATNIGYIRRVGLGTDEYIEHLG